MNKLGPYLLGPNDTPENGIYTGDARELAKAIPGESVDMVFTDPPYPKEFLHLFGWCGRTSARVLKIGKRCLVLSGQFHLPDVIISLSESLEWSWLIGQVCGGTYSCQIFPERIWSRFKPCLVFRNGKLDGSGNWVMDCFRDTASAWIYSKKFHKWGQGASFFAYYIDRLTEPDDIIVDFFCGGGTVPAVCKILGRRWLAFEIDPATAELARKRVRKTQPPLKMPMPEQLELIVT